MPIRLPAEIFHISRSANRHPHNALLISTTITFGEGHHEDLAP